jgi:hypothetical protein
VLALARELNDGCVTFNTIEGIARLGDPHAGERVDVPLEEYEHRYGRLLETLVDAVDWTRVLLEAHTRHIALDHTVGRHAFDRGPCGDCVAEALLNPRPGVDWTRTPTVPRLPAELPPADV